MSVDSTTTGYARLSRFQARAVLAGLLLSLVGCLAISLSPLSSGFVGSPRNKGSDVALYQAEVARIAEGEAYYEAASAELTERGYPTSSVFNWRTPLPMWLLGVLPSPMMGKVLLGLLAFAALGMTLAWLAKTCTPPLVMLGGLTISGALMFSVLGDLYVMPVIWAGVLILLSLCAYGLDKTRVAVIAGLAAVFVRDVAGPYCVAAMLIAVSRRQWREAAAWFVGLAAYGVFFAAHCWAVSGLVTADAISHSESWLRMGGAAFLISATQMHAYLILLPQWVAALFLPLALFGFAGWHSPSGQRAGIVAAMYCLLFAVIGHDFNQFWGAMLVPTLCLGFAHAPAAVGDLWRAAGYGSSRMSLSTSGS
jgi:hypothetical protein